MRRRRGEAAGRESGGVGRRRRDAAAAGENGGGGKRGENTVFGRQKHVIGGETVPVARTSQCILCRWRLISDSLPGMSATSSCSRSTNRPRAFPSTSSMG